MRVTEKILRDAVEEIAEEMGAPASGIGAYRLGSNGLGWALQRVCAEHDTRDNVTPRGTKLECYIALNMFLTGIRHYRLYGAGETDHV